MTTLDQSGTGAGASDQPAENPATPDLDQIVQRAVAAALSEQDKRFTGFQSLIDRKFGDLSRQFKTAGLSAEQQAQLEEEEEQAEIDRLRRENELLKSRDKYPVGADILVQLASATSLEDQLSIIEEAVRKGELSRTEGAQVAEAVADAQAQTPVPQVDRNSPARPVKPGINAALEAGQMTDEMADAILGIGS